MNLTNETFAPLRVLVDELARGGVRHAVASPGSRNAPIIHALGDHPELRVWSVLDERSAGYFALGIAKSTGTPVAVTCTSGTAAANLHPAVIEADLAGVPLVLLTADRPPELRDVGASQAIDQIKLFGASVRWFVEAGNHPLTPDTLRHFRSLGSRAVAEATASNPGPVHLNLPLREPLHPVAGDTAGLDDTLVAVGRADGAPWTAVTRPAPTRAFDALAGFLSAERPLIVVGEQNVPGLAAAVAAFAAAAGAPVLADALSQMRRTSLSEDATLVCAYDLILGSEVARETLVPDHVLRIGELPTSKSLRGRLASLDCPQTVIDSRGVLRDATRVATETLVGDPLTLVTAVAARLADEGRPLATDWTSIWRDVETAAQSAIDTALDDETFAFEPAVYRTLLRELDAGATIFVSSSMPVRDVEAFAAPGRDDVRFLANRGANGIDGVLSSALGAKAPWECDRVILLTGDLAFLYDAGALSIAHRHEIPITVVCVDNSGGGIFSFLPISEHPQHFEPLIATPHAVDLSALCSAYGFAYTRVDSPDGLRSAVDGAGMVHISTDRTRNRDGHQRVAETVKTAVEAVIGATV